MIALPRLHVLTDARVGVEDLRSVDLALSAGVKAVQVRVKDRTDREHVAIAMQVARRCRDAGALCIVNDRVDIALAVGADAVHLGAGDLPVDVARAVAGDRLLIGGTARDAATARRLVDEGADYLGVGPMYATSTKDGLPAPLGAAGVADVVAAVDVPVIAIAGIDASRIGEVLATGAHGAAVVGAVVGAPDPAVATRELLAAIEHVVGGT